MFVCVRERETLCFIETFRPVRRLLKKGVQNSGILITKWGANLKKIQILRPKLGM